MAAIKKFQDDFGKTLAAGALKIERAKYPERGEVVCRALLEGRYGVWSRSRGATWNDYVTGARPMPLKLIRRLTIRYRHAPRPSSAPRKGKIDDEIKRMKRAESMRQKLSLELIKLELQYPAHDRLILKGLSPEFYRRLTRVRRDLAVLVSGALRDVSDIKQTAILDVLEPVVEKLGG
jgi:hypothetical protein